MTTGGYDLPIGVLEKQMPLVATETVQNASQLADYVGSLQADIEAEPEKWENVTLDRYLEALSAVLRDHQGEGSQGPRLLSGHEEGSMPYRVLAEILTAAAIYE